MSTPSIQTLRADAQQVLNLDSISAVRSVVAATLANANAGTPLNPNLTTQQLWNEFYQIVTQPKSDIESIIANQLMKFMYAPPAPGGVGADKQVIFNDGGVLAGDVGLQFNKTTDTLQTGALVVPGNVQLATVSTLYVGTLLNPKLKVDVGGTGVTTITEATITGDLTARTTGLTVNSSGVGVGTSSQSSFLGNSPKKLVIGDGTQTPALTLYGGTTNVSGIYYAKGTVGNQAYRGFFEYDHSVDALNFGIAGSTAMTLNSTGLGVGQVPSTSKLEVGITNTSTAGLIEANSLKIENNNATVNNAAGLFLSQTGNAGCGIAGIATSRTGGSRTSDLVLYYYNQASSASPIEGLRLNSSGNVGIGVVPSGYRLYVKADISSVVGGAFIESGEYNQKGLVVNCTNPFLASNIFELQKAGTALLTLDSAGNLILQSSATPATLATNGQLTVNATSNTNLRFSYRGSDGTTRVANITLA